MEEKPTFSIVLPMYNEAQAVSACIAAVSESMGPLGTFELVCVDDGSSDETLERLREAASTDPRVVPLALSRNFGKEAAMAAGLEAARGDAVIFMDADLQHPPSLLAQLVEKWREGYEVVNAVKTGRGQEGVTYRLFARMFNGLMSRAAGTGFQGASDFKLLDRCVVDALLQFPERSRFFRGLVAWLGFRECDVPFEVADRVAGARRWGTRQLIRYSLSNLLAFSDAPLLWTAMLGAAAFCFAVAFAVYELVSYFTVGTAVGFSTVIVLQVFFGGLTLAGLGVISLYVGQVYREAKQRPVYIVRPAPPRPAAPQESSASHPRDTAR